jgi:hypothetical protein
MTITAITNAQGYNWSEWLIGIMRSFLSGGAAAFITLGGGALTGVPPNKLWVMVGINFLVMGLYRMGEFLQLHGAPDKLQVALNTAEDAAKDVVVAVQDAKAAAGPGAPNQ